MELAWDKLKGKNLYRLGDATSNISCGIVQQVSGLFAKVFTIGIFYFFYHNFRFFTIEPNLLSTFILWIGVDFFYYWAHRHSHTINLFWIGHSVHHQSEDYNLSVALRQGSFQVLFTSWYYIPLALVGFDPNAFLFVAALNTLYQFWIHTELIRDMGIFEYVFNTPSHHRVHHARNLKYLDKNHAGSLIIWDKMFGTFAKEEDKPTYGVTTPIDTFDPVSAHTKPIRNLWNDLKQVSGFTNKLKLLFMPPGWMPENLGGFRKPKEPEANYLKFDFTIPTSIQYYVFFQYALILVATSIFLFSIEKLALFQQIMGAFTVVISVMIIGQILSVRKSALNYETIRIVVSGMIFFILLNHNLLLVMAALAPLAFSLIWLLKVRKEFEFNQNEIAALSR